ncbi:hypothetical protein ABK040_002938 [Willaertia magna]
MPKQILTLPNSKIAGHIIGKGGSQIKQIKDRTNCKININSYNNTVEIIGHNQNNVDKAKYLINIIINNSIAVYEHPNVVCNVYLLTSEETKFHLIEYKPPFVYGNTNHNMNNSGKVFALTLVEKEENDLISKMSNLKISENKINTEKVSQSFIYSPETERYLVEEGIKRSTQSFKELVNSNSSKECRNKTLIKISLGKKTFYSADRNDNSVNASKLYDFKSFSELNIGFGKDLKSTFKTEIEENFVKQLKETMLNNGWKFHSEIVGVSCHCIEVVDGIIEKDGKGGKRLNFKIVPIDNDSNKCKLIKIRTHLNKLMFLDICSLDNSNNSIFQPDLRVRFQTEQHLLNVNSNVELLKYISFLELKEDGLSEDKVPRDLSLQFRKDIFRYKKKEIYVLNDEIKLTINFVNSEGKKLYEVKMSPIKPFILIDNEQTVIEATVKLISKMKELMDLMNQSNK